MKSNKEIVQFIEERIGHVYFRPRMYGGSASGVDLILHYYHDLWAEIFDKLSLYHSIRDKSYEDLHCGAANFSTKYQMDNPTASDIGAAFFVVDQWMKISDSLGLKIPYDKIRNMFKHSESININQKLL
ncbi:MAG: hypothetical protein ABIK92_12365 [Pseudomonadota bacterium]